MNQLSTSGLGKSLDRDQIELQQQLKAVDCRDFPFDEVLSLEQTVTMTTGSNPLRTATVVSAATSFSKDPVGYYDPGLIDHSALQHLTNQKDRIIAADSKNTPSKELQVQKWVNDIRVHASGNNSNGTHNNGSHGNSTHNNSNHGSGSHSNSWEDKEDVEGIMEILVKYKAVLPNKKQELEKISAGKLFEVIEEVHEDLIKQEELVRYWETKAKNFKEKYEAEVEKHKNKAPKLSTDSSTTFTQIRPRSQNSIGSFFEPKNGGKMVPINSPTQVAPPQKRKGSLDSLGCQEKMARGETKRGSVDSSTLKDRQYVNDKLKEKVKLMKIKRKQETLNNQASLQYPTLRYPQYNRATSNYLPPVVTMNNQCNPTYKRVNSHVQGEIPLLNTTLVPTQGSPLQDVFIPTTDKSPMFKPSPFCPINRSIHHFQPPQAQRPEAKTKTAKIHFPTPTIPTPHKIPASDTTLAVPSFQNAPASSVTPNVEITASTASNFLERGKTPTENQQWSYRYQLDQGITLNPTQKPALKQKKSNSFPNLTLNFNFGDAPNHRTLERVESSLSNDGKLMRELGSILQ